MLSIYTYEKNHLRKLKISFLYVAFHSLKFQVCCEKIPNKKLIEMHKDSFYDIIDQVISHGVTKGILHLYSENEKHPDNSIILKGKQVVNFGSCSYLGLELDQRLKDGARDAIENYGTQFSSSRAYISLGLYEKLESLFEKIFDAHCIVTPTTTLGHLANLPVLISDKDAVVIDQQVHSSVQMAVSLVKAKGIYTEIIRHNRMDLLDERIRDLQNKYSKIWYLADGIYSMYGDSCPVEETYDLMNRYEKLHCYIDDAHGMSIYGKNGRGYVLNKRAMHPKVIIATSLAKAFATGGAVMIYPNREMARKVRTCGGPLITSGPLQPSNLGAAIACAQIHLSSEITQLQHELHEKITHATKLLKQYNLPVVSHQNASIFFVGASIPKLGYNIVNRMLNKGFYVNLGVFPAVPMKNTGIRFTITRLHTYEQITEMIKTLALEFNKALSDEAMTLNQICKAFKLPASANTVPVSSKETAHQTTLQLKDYKTIYEIDIKEWDTLFQDKGTFDWNGVTLLEKCFTNNDLPENNWLFDYIFVRDIRGKVVAATFLTTSLWKDDMLSPATISDEVEKRRIINPYYLTSRVISTGSLLTEGQHLFLDKNSKHWKHGLQMLLEKVHELQEKYKANNIILRDFHTHDHELDTFFLENDFLKIYMPDTNVLENIKWKTKEEFYEQLSKRSKQHYREDVRKHQDKFETTVIQNPSEDDISEWYKLYINVKEHSLELNTFTLSEKLFRELSGDASWETIVLKLKPAYNPFFTRAVAVVWCYKTRSNYIPMIIGIDYIHNKEYKIYRQALFQIVVRAAQLNKQKIYFGFSAAVEKKKLGAKQISAHAYMQYKDGYNLEVLSGLRMNSNSSKEIIANKE